MKLTIVLIALFIGYSIRKDIADMIYNLQVIKISLIYALDKADLASKGGNR